MRSDRTRRALGRSAPHHPNLLHSHHGVIRRIHVAYSDVGASTGEPARNGVTETHGRTSDDWTRPSCAFIRPLHLA